MEKKTPHEENIFNPRLSRNYYVENINFNILLVILKLSYTCLVALASPYSRNVAHRQPNGPL